MKHISMKRVGVKKTVSSVVDPLLFKGGKSIDEIARVLKKRGPKLSNAYTPWYVHNRIWLLKQTGAKVVKSKKGTVRVIGHA